MDWFFANRINRIYPMFKYGIIKVIASGLLKEGNVVYSPVRTMDNSCFFKAIGVLLKIVLYHGVDQDFVTYKNEDDYHLTVARFWGVNAPFATIVPLIKGHFFVHVLNSVNLGKERRTI